MDFRERNKTHGTGKPELHTLNQLKFATRLVINADGTLVPDEQLFKKAGASRLQQIAQEAPEQWGLLKEVLIFIFTDKAFMPASVKQWLLEGANVTYREFADANGMNFYTFRNAVHTFRDKLMQSFGDWAIDDLLGNRGLQHAKKLWLDASELERYSFALYRQTHTVQMLQQQLTVSLKPYKDERQPHINQDDYEELLSKLYWMVSKPAQEALLKDCERAGLFGYINHLLSSSAIQGPDTKNYLALMRVLQGLPPEEAFEN